MCSAREPLRDRGPLGYCRENREYVASQRRREREKAAARREGCVYKEGSEKGASSVFFSEKVPVGNGRIGRVCWCVD